MLTIGVDIGGTKVAAGRGQRRRRSDRPRAQAHPADQPGAGRRDAVAEVVRELAQGRDDRGRRRRRRRVRRRDPVGRAVRAQPGLARGAPAEGDQRAIGLPVVVENDANAAAWGESTFRRGGGDEARRLHHGRHRHRRRPRLRRQAVPRPLRRRGRARPHAGGPRTAGCAGAASAAAGSSTPAAAPWSSRPRQISTARRSGPRSCSAWPVARSRGEEVTEAAKLGDEASLAAFASLADLARPGHGRPGRDPRPGLLHRGRRRLRAADLFLDRARETFARQLTGRGHRPLAEIRLAELGAAAGVVGAADLARMR